MPGADVTRFSILLLLFFACTKPSEVNAASGGASTNALPEKPLAKPLSAEPAKPPQGAPDVVSAPISSRQPQDAGSAGTPSVSPAMGDAVDAQILIWGGGRTLEEGREALERFEKERDGLEAVLALGAGYPRLIASDTLQGLNPGFQVVILGACRPDEAKEPLSTLQAFRSGVYARAVKMPLASGTCPKLENQLQWAGTERVAEKPFELTAVNFMAIDPSASKVPWLVRLYLRDATGGLVDQAAVDPRYGIWAGTDRNSCFAQVAAEHTAIRVTVDCENLAGGPAPKKRHEEFVYKIGAGKIEEARSH